MNRRLYKSEDNRILCGVCGGLGEFLGIDPTIIRLIWALLARNVAYNGCRRGGARGSGMETEQ